MTEQCTKDTKIALIERDIADQRKEHTDLKDELSKIDSKLTSDIEKLRTDLNHVLSEANSFKSVLRTLQVISIAVGTMLVDYLKKRTGWF